MFKNSHLPSFQEITFGNHKQTCQVLLTIDFKHPDIEPEDDFLDPRLLFPNFMAYNKFPNFRTYHQFSTFG